MSIAPAAAADPDRLSPEKHARILLGAARIFARDGYEGASMAQIALEAGVSKGTLYNHFDTKAELFATWVEQTCKERLDRLFDALNIGDDPVAVLTELGLRMVETLLSDVGLTIFRVTISEARKFPELGRRFFEAAPARGLATLAAWLAEQTSTGRLCVADPVLAAGQFFSLCDGILVTKRRLLIGNAPTPEESRAMVDAAVAMFLRSYGPAPTPPIPGGCR